MLPKSGFFGLHFGQRQYGSNINHFDVIDPKAVEFGEVKQNNGHHTVQRHWSSLIPAPVGCSSESVY